MRRIARFSAVLLLMLWVGPVSFVQVEVGSLLALLGAPQPARSAADVVSEGEAVVLQPGTLLELRLRNGQKVRGQYLGRSVLDSAEYAPRFAAAPLGPLALGETLHVTLHDGREWVAPFEGYGELSLLLRAADGQRIRVPFEFARTIARSDGQRVEPKKLTRAFRSGALPSAEVLLLEGIDPVGSDEERHASALQIPAQDIERTILRTESGGVARAALIIAVVGGLVLIVVLASRPTKPSCSPDFGNTPLFGGLTPTDRAFDRERGLFVGDSLVWTGAMASDGELAPVAMRASSAALREMGR